MKMEKIFYLQLTLLEKQKNEKLSRLLLDYLLGHGIDGESKEAKYLFRFYVGLEQYSEAASTAVIISRDQQLKGDYKKAREILFGMSRDLKMRGIKNPAEMSSSLLLLHSYLLVRPTLSVRNDHVTAARLLCRVAKSISKFQMHIVQLLTKTVIECNKTGLKKIGI
jgi:WD repeat-containing protein 19